jgi:hypothetical protein
LKLAFRLCQRVEGTFHVAPGMRVAALDARVYESGSAAPRASRIVTAV